MPGPKKIKQDWKGPNVGYRPYWYGYNFQLNGKPKQKNPLWALDDGIGAWDGSDGDGADGAGGWGGSVGGGPGGAGSWGGWGGGGAWGGSGGGGAWGGSGGGGAGGAGGGGAGGAGGWGGSEDSDGGWMGGWGRSSHEDWENGLDIGDGGNHSLMAKGRNDTLGAGSLLDKDLETSGEKPACFPNLGPDCELGRPAWNYTHAELMELKTRTEFCDHCLPEFQKVGLVCTEDRKSKLQEMDYCVMLKMNCLGGTAYRAGDNWRYNSKHSKVPFAMRQQWIRFACRGWKDAEVKMFTMYPYKLATYWVIVYGWPGTGPKSAIYADAVEPYKTPTMAYRSDWYWGWATNDKTFTEYTIVWNKKNGWFLISQGRQKEWKKLLNMEFVDPHPRKDIRYWDVAAGWAGWHIEYVLSGLKELNRGPCKFIPKIKKLPSGTKELHKEVRLIQKQYEGRVEKANTRGQKSSGLSGQEGNYLDSGDAND